MITNGLKYYRGSRGSYETLEGDITRSSDGTYLTTCVVNVYLLISGIASHPCGNGDDYTLTPEQQLKVLKFVQEERKKITDSFPVKTLEGWHESGLPTFEDYCFPGDTVDGEMVDYFVNSVPPVTLRPSCTQAGEAFSTALDPETERWRDTYTTFSRLSSSLWRFEGYCFKGQTNNRVEAKTRLERRIEVLRGGGGGENMNNRDYKEKIRKLLALAESPNEHEAKAALLKARELMAEHKLTEADLKDAAKKKVKKITTDITCSKRRDPWIIHLSATIGENYCCKSWRSWGYGQQTQTVGFTGLEDDVEVCAAVFNYAVDCARAQTKRIKKENSCYYSSYVKKLCDSYGYGFVVGLQTAFEKQQEENESGWGLVMVMPQEVIEATKYLGKKEFRASTLDDISGSEYAKGYTDGKAFDPTKRLAEEVS